MLRRGVGSAIVVVLAACARSPEAPRVLARSERFGILRDLVVVPRAVRAGGPYFLDRFETTCADYEAWLDVRAAGPEVRADFARWNAGSDPELPVIGIDLGTARRYARWRFGRLPRADEWRFASSVGGRHVLPWGDAPRSTWANSEELGLWRLAPVGAFESGRAPDGLYDLVGNAAEWTESVAQTWSDISLFSRGEALLLQGPLAAHGPGAAASRARRLFAIRPWIDLLVPSSVLIGIESPHLPRLVVRGLDAGLPRPRPGDPSQLVESDVEVRMPADRSWVIGLRVATDPSTLVECLVAEATAPDDAEREALVEFLRRSDVRELLRSELRQRRGRATVESPVARILREELGS
ncbi:MAG: SUMF1/EgtB/PvdO family nonheme iron enzyme [Planctomycetota bacterium]